MRYPKFLQPGGRVGFIAPSFGCADGPYAVKFQAALKRFREGGYQTVIGPNCSSSSGFGKSNTPEACAAEVNDFFLRDRSDIIISCGGGETMCEDLPFVDFGAIAQAEPRWFMGFSDNTNLTFTLPVLADTAAVYGPCASSFGMKQIHPSLEDALALLEGRKLSFGNYDFWEKYDAGDEDPLAGWNCSEPYAMRAFVRSTDGFRDTEGEVRFSGRMIGGCLDCLACLCGTSFDRVESFSERYAADGIVWFLEACDLNPMGIRRALWQLENAGWFRHVSGFIIGRPLQYDAEFCGLDRIRAVTGILEKYGVPVLMDVDLGHLPPMMPFISGAVADITAETGKLSVEYYLI